MPSTYTLISSNVLSSSAASVTFSAIPSTYTDLVLRFTARTNSIYLAGLTKLQIAGADTSLSATWIISDPSTPAVTSSRGGAWLGYWNGGGTTANTFGSGEIYISQYASTTSYKAISGYGTTEQNAVNARSLTSAGLYSSNSAISSITLIDVSGDSLVSGSSFYLYGIKNS